jgi:hypothetical protein
MKNLILTVFILLLTLNLSGQKKYVLLTPIRFERRTVEIPEGKMVRIKFSDNVHKSVRGNLEIRDDSLITAGGDTIVLNNIKKIIFRNSESGISGGITTAGGLAITIGCSIWLSVITISEEIWIAALQIFGGMLLVGAITYGVIFTAVGITTLIRGKAYKAYGNHGYHLSIVYESQKSNSLYTP